MWKPVCCLQVWKLRSSSSQTELCLALSLDLFVPGDGCARSMLLSNLSVATHGQAQVQHMLEHGRVQDKERIIDVVKARILDFAMDKHSSAALSSQDATSALRFI